MKPLNLGTGMKPLNLGTGMKPLNFGTGATFPPTMTRGVPTLHPLQQQLIDQFTPEPNMQLPVTHPYLNIVASNLPIPISTALSHDRSINVLPATLPPTIQNMMPIDPNQTSLQDIIVANPVPSQVIGPPLPLEHTGQMVSFNPAVNKIALQPDLSLATTLVPMTAANQSHPNPIPFPNIPPEKRNELIRGMQANKVKREHLRYSILPV